MSADKPNWRNAMTPNINLNGTSAEELIKIHRAAYSAIGATIKAMKDTCPNGRDYPAQNMEPAVSAYRERMRQLEAMRTDLEVIIRGIQKQAKPATAICG